jgi:hypothetical protein
VITVDRELTVNDKKYMVTVIHIIAKNTSTSEKGTISPYPTEVNVVIVQYIDVIYKVNTLAFS